MAVVAIVLLALPSVQAAAAPDRGNQSRARDVVREVQVFEAERTSVPNPAGLAFSSDASAFYVLGAAREGQGADATDVVTLKPFEFRPGSDRAGSARIAAAVKDPVNMAFDTRRNRLLLLGAGRRLLEVGVGSDGELDARSADFRDTVRLKLPSPQGMAVDPASGTLFVLNARPSKILRIERGPDGSLDSASVAEIGLPSVVSDPRGLALDYSTGHLHLRDGQKLYELTPDGDVVAARDLSGLDLVAPQGMTFAPSGDQTDDPGQLSVYLADSGGGAANSAGQIVELSVTPLAEAAAADFTSSLVRTVDMSTWNPPSPDPSGVTYLSGSNRLLMTDGEVEETVNGITHFEGANVWEYTLGGTVTDTANISTVEPTVTPMTDEPTGVTYSESTGRYYVTEDGRKRVYTLNPGGDGEIGTGDDSWIYFVVSGFGNTDPEGITYDTTRNRLFVADGTNAEIFEYTTAGAYVGQFDVARYGVGDPETVEYNPASGTLFTLSNRPSGPIIVETTIGGGLVRTIDAAAAYAAGGGRKPAGLAYAPASNGSGDKRFYLVDRGIDNDSNPNIVDGKMFELTAPGGGGGGGSNDPPSVNAGPDQTITLPAGAALNGTVSDDGQPTPPSLTTTWTEQSGPGTVIFGNANAVDTTATFSQAGTYVLRLTASDGDLSSFDQLTVIVNPAGGTSGSPLYFSLGSKATVGGIAAANEDVLFFDGTDFSRHFDGSDVGVGSFRIDAFARLDATSLLISFDGAGTIPGISGSVDDSDVVRFDATSLGETTAGAFSLYFDGSDVGLTETSNAYDVDALELLAGGDLLISTAGAFNVGGVSAADKDLVRFAGTTGPNTSGSFSLYFDGSDVGLSSSGEDVDGAALDASGRIHLSTTGVFAVSGVSGQDEDDFRFTPTSTGQTTSGSYDSTLYFDGSAFGLDGNDLFAIDLP
ncbi:MAG: hypothetical protein H0U00_02735 [Actinobacteria bacterium]|nr:hypothetical protein [Actinomycetota bacterium]